jgi:DNA repair protein RadA/Sms
MKICEYCKGVIGPGRYQCPECLNFSFHAKEIDEFRHVDDRYNQDGDNYDEDIDNDDSTDESEEIVLESLDRVDYTEAKRIKTGPWDSVFGGGIAIGSTNLLGGSPGAGKSTICLAIANAVAAKRNVFYIAAEEAPGQIAQRCKRLELSNLKNIIVYNAMKRGIAGLTIDELAGAVKPRLIVLDSIQGITLGESKQDEMAAELCLEIKDYCARHKCAAIIINHMTKDQELWGKSTIQHHVDGTFAFTVDSKGVRTLSSIKNRFGQTPLHISFVMTSYGLSVCK